MVVTFGWWLVAPKGRGERSDSEVPLPWIVDSESVGVDGVGAEPHEFVDPLLKLLVDGVGAGVDVLKAADRLFCAVSHVDDKLVIGGVGEAVDHGLVGLWVAGEWSSPMSLR